MKILELTYEQLTHRMKKRYGKGEFHARAVYRDIFQNGNRNFENADEFSFSKSFSGDLKQDLKLNLDPVVLEQMEGDLIKFATRLGDGGIIESVVIPMATHGTVCISCQVGCRMGCRFCRTARLELARNLTVEEIVGQVYTAKFRYRVMAMNVVFMGMGEPFDNFRNVVQAIRVIADQRGLNIAKRHITLSTVGIADGIDKLGALNWPQIQLAISLNAPNDSIRSRIMPINRKIPMKKLKAALIRFPLRRAGAFFIEYVLIKGINDSRNHARELARYLGPLNTKVNIIPCNRQPDSPFYPPPETEIKRFCNWLIQENLFVRLRSVKGRGIMAACGQLGYMEGPV